MSGDGRRARLEALLLEFNTWGFDARNYRKSTRRQYALEVRRCSRWLAANDRPALTVASARDLRDWLWSLKPSAETRNQARKALLAWFAFLVDTGRRRDDPTEDLPAVPEPRRVPRARENGEAERLLARLGGEGPRARLAVLLMLLGGLRLSEARLLQWQAFEGAWLRFAGKGGRERRVSLHPAVLAAAERWRTECPDPRWVFPSPRYPGEPLSETAFRAMVRGAAEAAGLEQFVPHQLRHTFATRLLELCGDVRVVQEALGHASLHTTQQYTKVRDVRVADAVAALTFSEADDGAA